MVDWPKGPNIRFIRLGKAQKLEGFVRIGLAGEKVLI